MYKRVIGTLIEYRVTCMNGYLTGFFFFLAVSIQVKDIISKIRLKSHNLSLGALVI